MHVAVSGKIASGKDTAAFMLAQTLKAQGYRPQPIKFADALYSLCAQYDDTYEWTVDGWNPHRELALTEKQQVTNMFFKQCIKLGTMSAQDQTPQLLNDVTMIAHQYPTVSGQKNRDRLKHIAEYCRAVISPDFWVKIAVQQFNSGDRANYTMIFSDLRTTPEALWCSQREILSLRIDVDPEIQRLRMLSKGMAWSPEIISFSTEVMLDEYPNFTARIENNGSYEDLREQILYFVQKCKRQDTPQYQKTRGLAG